MLHQSINVQPRNRAPALPLLSHPTPVLGCRPGSTLEKLGDFGSDAQRRGAGLASRHGYVTGECKHMYNPPQERPDTYITHKHIRSYRAITMLQLTLISLFLQGFWYTSLTVGSQNFSLAVDTGSFAVLIGEGKYKPNPTSQQTNQGEFIQFNGANEDGTMMATEVFLFVKDEAKFSGANLHEFLVGNITDGDPLGGDGIIGFSPPASMITDPNDPTFLAGQSLAQAVCDLEGISPCEFGLALKTDGSGSLIFGAIDHARISGSITTLPTIPVDAWIAVNTTEADSPVLVVDGKSVTHLIPIFDNGTPNIIGPVDIVRSVLLSVGYDLIEQTDSESGITNVFGTYDCARPTEVHYIDEGANVLNRTADGKTCTANILGSSIVTAPDWQIGQTWYQGRYVQHDLDAHTISFADLAS
ncbi:aspartic peptidase domain-containing protein [Daedaleopsis nitida]|nr:aspartic peptidase domain-containing protein [Daedaleopsis nitida]